MLAQSAQLTQPEITVAFDLDRQPVSTTRRQLMPSVNGRDIFTAAPTWYSRLSEACSK